MTSRADQAQLRAEVLALRRQVQVLERQIKRVRWTPGDRMLLAALRDHLPRSAWAGLLVRPETVLGWHRALVRPKWAAYVRRPRRGRPRISTECRELIRDRQARAGVPSLPTMLRRSGPPIFCRPDPNVPDALHHLLHQSWESTARPLRSDRPSDRGLGLEAADRSYTLGPQASIPDP